jgi:hypothetical protein
METILNEDMFNLPSDSLTKELKITKSYVLERLEKNNFGKLQVA